MLDASGVVLFIPKLWVRARFVLARCEGFCDRVVLPLCPVEKPGAPIVWCVLFGLLRVFLCVSHVWGLALHETRRACFGVGRASSA